MNKLKFFICIFWGLTLFSCNEEKWLKEKPYDFYAPDNSFETVAHFKQKLNYMYDMLRFWYFTYGDQDYHLHLYCGGDFAYSGWPDDLDDNYNKYTAAIHSTSAYVEKNWSYYYQVIAKANDVLTMLETNASEVPEANKLTFRGEALFFRAYYYRLLAHLWGDVPLVTEMLTSPKLDFVRAPRNEVYAQCQQDLEEAIGLLADIDKVADGAINKQIAQHILAEVYICQGNHTKAIEVANAVINHPATGLMTERFGSYKDDPTKNVFFDLFRSGNQNRAKSPNTEGLLVLQYDYQNGSPYERNLARYIMPQLRSVTVKAKDDAKGKDDNGNVLACSTFTMEDGGRGNGYYATTHYFRKTIWASDYDNDIRNASCNIYRDFRIDNVEAVGHGQWIVKDGWLRTRDTFAFIFPAVTKFCGFEAIPDVAYQMKNGAKDTTSLGKHIIINNGNNATGSFTDEYLVRLSETYLLLAEAYVRNGQLGKAAEAVNVVRSRAKASPATAAQMNIEYILDERMRELAGEEVRNYTLFRMGIFVDRAKKYNPAGKHVGAWQNFWPIPFSEIEKNTGAVLTQNEGYGAKN